MTIGRWTADDHGWTKAYKKKKLPGGAAIPGCDEEKVAEGAPYGGPRAPIPDAPKYNEKAPLETEKPIALRQFADAPGAAQAADPFVRQVLGKDKLAPRKQDAMQAPPPENPITVVLKYHFRLALYCLDDCLGSFEWSSEETIQITPTWKEATEADGGPSVKVGGMPNQQKKQPPARKGRQGGEQNQQPEPKQYILIYEGKRISNPPVKIGAWKPGTC
jgi:hypothetical protein